MISIPLWLFIMMIICSVPIAIFVVLVIGTLIADIVMAFFRE